ncbi:hypothetical protein [Porphyromonas gingivalis]|uniref:Uncharacterized protein n=1 Tax=Porphyromonas phage phage030a_KCOM2803 TaxID=3154120 RepID=A0AAT9JEP8_9CAUD|nr:hypothetical protein [Porphyromonas gingivalis]
MEKKSNSLKQDYSPKVRTFGSLGYSPQRIADLLNLKGLERSQFLICINTHGDPLNLAYRNGEVIGEWNIDAALSKQAETGDVDAIKLRNDRILERKIADMKREKFGL